MTVELILDGHHIAGDAARVALRAARGRVVLVTDGLAAAGMGDGEWRMGSVDVTVRDGVARLADGTLAGSVLTMPAAVRNLLQSAHRSRRRCSPRHAARSRRAPSPTWSSSTTRSSRTRRT